MSDTTAPDALPKGWALAPLQDLAAAEPNSLVDGPFGSNLKTSHYRDEGPLVIRLQNIGDGEFLEEAAHISVEHFETLKRHEALGDDVVVAILGSPLPRACLVPPSLGAAIVKADCVRLRVHPQLALPRFAKYAINSDQTRQRAMDLIHGVGRPRINLRDLRTLGLPVAPFPEQTRIVEAIESYFTRLDNAVATLERVQANLKRYRASVLKAAVEGRLVPTEAELARQEGRDYEPASVLLNRILVERRRRWEEAELAAMKAKGKAPKDDKWKAKYDEPVAPDTSKLPDLPEGWCWASPAQFFDWASGKFLPKKSQAGGSIPVYGGNGINGFHSESLVDHATLVIGRVGAHCGNVHVTDSAAWITDNAIYGETQLDRSSLEYWRLSLSKQNLNARSGGSGQPFVNQGHLNELAIPLPPESEQGRIVVEIDRLLSVVANAEAQIEQTLTRAARLRQSILKWAFDGKLADQDPNDEPASLLLERIKAEREQAGVSRRTKKPFVRKVA